MLEVILACSVIAFVSWKSDVLSPAASFIAFLIGALLWGLNGFSWMFLLLSFLVVGYVGTKWRYDWKKDKGFEESSNGSRSIENVLGNGISPTFFAIAMNPIAFSGAISTALADTLASEIGVVCENTKLITTLEKVEPGTDGGISILGSFSALLGSSAIAILSFFALSINPLGPLIGGFLGCQVDSLLGATLERWGYLSKSLVNLIATFSGGLIALFILGL